MWHPTGTKQTKKQRNQDEYAVIPVTPEPSPARGERASRSYDDHLALAGQVADHFAQSDAFAEAQATWTANTRRRYLNDLELFSAYLESAHIERPAEALFNDAGAWRGMTFGLLKGFKTWLEQRGYATGTIKGSISTIHVFCRLAGPAPGGLMCWTKPPWPPS